MGSQSTFAASCRGGGFRRPGQLFVVAVAALAGLVACGGSGGDDFRIAVSGGQSPDPVVVDIPIAYITRMVGGAVGDDGAMEDAVGAAVLEDDARELLGFVPGAKLLVRERAAPSGAEQDLTPLLGEGSFDIRDLNVSFDGERLLFAARGPFDETLDDDEQPTWNLWEYDLPGATMRRVIASDTIAETGQDRFPAYLPDGRILFSSTRQRRSRAVLLDEGKPQFEAQDEDRREPAFVLHAMNPDGSDIRQISFNMSHDLAPTVLDDGRIVFSRWDRAGGANAIDLYRMNPDGTDLELFYGANSHETGTDGATVQFLRPRPLDGGLLTQLRPFSVDDGGTDLIRIDTAAYVDDTQPVAGQAGVLGGPAQTRATVNDVRTDGSISPGGRYSSAWPLDDGSGRMFVTWSLCRLLDADGRVVPCSAAALEDPDAQPAPPLYGLFLYDAVAETQVPVLAPAENLMYAEVVAAQPRPLPLIRFDATEDGSADAQLVESASGLLDIRSVYDIAGEDRSGPGIAVLADPAQRTAAERPARFLRISKAVSIPDRDLLDFAGSAFGRGGARGGMREILGYAPIEPDGSVVVQVPADVALSIEVLDGAGRRIGERHRSWLQVRPGQRLACNGCHESNLGLSHGRADAFESIHAGAPVTGQPFPNTRSELFADFGETMAQVRARVSCATDCAALRPSVDVVFEDLWTDEALAGRAADAAFAWRYADLQTPAPTTPECSVEWNSRCRTVIHYESHIHPLWSLPRQTLDPDDGFTVLADDTCTLCHSREDAMGAVRIPAGDLDLSDGVSPVQADHFNAYRELLFTRNEREVAGGILQDRLVETGVDPETGDPVLSTIPIAPSMAAGRARSAGRFLDRFDPGGSHAGWLTAAELRLLSEWMDIGAQYYNDPFAAPEN